MSKTVKRFKSKTGLAILSLLAERPKHGYQLMRELAARAGGHSPSFSSGTVYPALQELSRSGLVAATNEGDKKVYTLTPAGRLRLVDEAVAVEALWSQAARANAEQNRIRSELDVIGQPFLELWAIAFRAAACAKGDSARQHQVKAVLLRASVELYGLASETTIDGGDRDC